MSDNTEAQFFALTRYLQDTAQEGTANERVTAGTALSLLRAALAQQAAPPAAQAEPTAPEWFAHG